MSIDEYRALGVHASDAAFLSEVAGAGLPGNLVVVTGADTGLAFTAAARAARSSLRGEHTDLDIHLALPDSDRWTIGEVDEKVLRPARLKAFDRTHVIVSDAGHMSGAAYDHVLKTVEEPTSGAQFWFVVRDPDQLPTTLRGRSAATVTVRPAPADERLELLTAAGADAHDATQIAQLAGDDIRLALAVAANRTLLDPLRNYSTSSWRSQSPTRDADDALTALLTLAAALPTADAAATSGTSKPRRATRAASATKKKSVRPRWDSIPAPARADARRLVHRLLDRWAADLRQHVGQAHTAEALREVETALVAVDRARSELATNAPAATVLPALLTRANTPTSS